MTATIPLQAKTFEYVPDSLRGIEGAPKFTLRYGTRRDKHIYRAELAGRGLISYSEDEIRSAMIEEIKRMSGNSDEAKDRMVDTATRYWAAISALKIERDLWIKDCIASQNDDPDADLPDAPVLDFDPEEEAWITGVMQTVQANSTVLKNMNKANVRRDFIASEVSLSAVLVSAEGFEIRRDADGLVEPDCLAELEEWLGDRAEELGAEEIGGGDPYSELRSTAFMAFHLPKATEKNFASLLLATSALSGSQAAAEDESSTSPMSEKSTETPSTTADTSTGETSSTLSADAEGECPESSGPTGEE